MGGGRLDTITSLMSNPPELRRGNSYVKANLKSVTGATWYYNIGADYWERVISLVATIVTSSTAGIRQYVFACFDGDNNAYAAVPLSVGIGPSQIAQVAATIGVPGITVAQGDALETEGRVVAPAAGAAIATVALTGGDWQVWWEVQLDGAAAAADENNFGLYSGANLIATSVNPPAAGGPYLQNPQTAQIAFSGANLAVKAIGAGTAGIGYTASLSATPGGNVTSYSYLPDIVQQSGYSCAIETINGAAGDVVGPVSLLTERYPSNKARYDKIEVSDELLALIALATGG